jgi:hypothetical protein
MELETGLSECDNDPDVFRYEPLQTVTSFRLVSITTERSPLFEAYSRPSVHLFEVTHPDDHEYEAISYTWDGQQPTEPIICNDKTLHVTRNVFQILDRIRTQNTTGTLWIDSICIDQNSTAEKNTQVPQMGEIFKGASKVWIYLGEATDRSAATFDYLQDVINLDYESRRYWGGDESDHYAQGKRVEFLHRRLYKRQEAFLGK